MLIRPKRSWNISSEHGAIPRQHGPLPCSKGPSRASGLMMPESPLGGMSDNREPLMCISLADCLRSFKYPTSFLYSSFLLLRLWLLVEDTRFPILILFRYTRWRRYFLQSKRLTRSLSTAWGPEVTITMYALDESGIHVPLWCRRF